MLFKEGTKIIFHLKSAGVVSIPTPQGVITEFGMMQGHFLGETEDMYYIDIISMTPHVKGYVPKDAIDVIGEPGEVEVPTRRIVS